MQFQTDMAEAANARLPRVAWLTCGMAIGLLLTTIVVGMGMDDFGVLLV